MIGVFASHHDWNDFTVRPLLGLEHIRYPGRIGPLVLTDREDGHVFGNADLVWYPSEDLELFVGFHHESEEPLLPRAILARTATSARAAGLKIYFGDGRAQPEADSSRARFGQSHTGFAPLHRDDFHAAKQSAYGRRTFRSSHGPSWR